MNSSISNSDPKAARLPAAILVYTVVLLCAYWGLVALAGWQATFGESNRNAGLLRLQALDQSRGRSAITIGTSITAKLRPGLIFGHLGAEPLNMGIDGGSSLFAAQKVLESQTTPELVLLEANLITKGYGENMKTLDEATEAVTFKLARHLAVLRRDYRPVTVLYSALKLWNDERRSSGSPTIAVDATAIAVERPATAAESPASETEMFDKWNSVLDQLQNRGVSVVLVMVPDGRNNREPEYDFSRRLAARHGLPFIDLKEHFDGRGLTYSDGTHLVRRSADTVSRTLNEVLRLSGLTE